MSFSSCTTIVARFSPIQIQLLLQALLCCSTNSWINFGPRSQYTSCLCASVVSLWCVMSANYIHTKQIISHMALWIYQTYISRIIKQSFEAGSEIGIIFYQTENTNLEDHRIKESSMCKPTQSEQMHGWPSSCHWVHL